MPTLDKHSSGEFVKLLYVGHSGSGKTGSLVSLIEAGYKLRIIDLDNGLDALTNFAREQCPDKMDAIQYETRRDKYKAGPTGPKVSGRPTAMMDTAKLIDKWSDDSIPEEWGPEYVLVIDSLTNLGKAAYEFARALNPGTREKRQWYQEGQNMIDDFIATITAESYQTNVIVCTHIDLRETGGVLKGFASSLGQALGPKIPRYFNTMVLAETVGIGAKARRVIKTMPTGQLDLKNPAPMRISGEYALATGMAEIFTKLKGK